MPSKSNTIEDVVNRALTLFPKMEKEQVRKLYEAAHKGGEIDQCGSVDAWLEKRFRLCIVLLDVNDYLKALTHALGLAQKFVPTDFGSSRQRDLGQLWTDTARGFLGEIGFAKFIKKLGYELVLDYSQGPLNNYLPSDIKEIRLPNGVTKSSRLKISVKTTKFGGIWLDIPGAQFSHSDVFILVKLGISREHFIAFLKSISVIRDKLLNAAVRDSIIDASEADTLWQSLPDFQLIPCYVAGFLDKRNCPPTLKFRPVKDRQKKPKEYLMQQYVGKVERGKPIGPNIPDDLPWKFASIGKFSPESSHFIANTGSLAYSDEEWEKLLNDLVGEG